MDGEKPTPVEASEAAQEAEVRKLAAETEAIETNLSKLEELNRTFDTAAAEPGGALEVAQQITS